MVWKAIAVTLLAVGIAAVAGVVGYNAGLAHGLAATGSPAGVAPYGPYHYGFGFFPFGFIFPLLFGFLMVSLIGKLFFWRHWHGHSHGYWEHRWHESPDDRPRGQGPSQGGQSQTA